MQKKKVAGFTALTCSVLLFATAVFCQPKKGDDLVKANYALGKSFVEDVLNAKTQEQLVNSVNKIISPNYIQHNPIAPPGKNGLIGFIGSFGQSYPDGKATLLDVFATKEKVVARWNFKGTLTGQPSMGATANGQQVDFDVIDIWTVKDGLLYEHWDQIDWTRFLAQLGVKEIPAPFQNLAKQPLNR